MRIRSIFTALTLGAALSVPATAQVHPALANPGQHAGMMNGQSVPHTVRGSYAVQLNKTEVVYLSEPAGAVVVGNPDIADVSIHSSDTLFIVGRGYGNTNILILNNAGHTIMNSDIQVTGTGTSNNIRVFAGASTMRTTYNCSPYCQPAPMLGDDTTFIGKNKATAPQITNTFATGSSVTRSQTIGVTGEPVPDPSTSSPGTEF